MLYICSVDFAQADSAIADWRLHQSARCMPYADSVLCERTLSQKTGEIPKTEKIN